METILFILVNLLTGGTCFYFGWKIRGMIGSTQPEAPKKIQPSWNPGNLLDPITSVDQVNAKEQRDVLAKLRRIQEGAD